MPSTIEIINSCMIQERMCASDAARQAGLLCGSYSTADIVRMRSIVARIEVRGAIHRAAQSPFFKVDRAGIERSVKRAYGMLIDEMKLLKIACADARVLSLSAIQDPSYDANRDAYVYVLHVDYEHP